MNGNYMIKKNQPFSSCFEDLTGTIGLGTFPLANVFTHISEKEAHDIFSTFFENGGKFIDTAPVYALGQVEHLVGNILSSYSRDSYYLATKCGFIWDTNRDTKLSGAYGDVIVECEKSLKRLNTEYIDIYMSHMPDDKTPFEETIRAMIDLQSQGKIRAIAVSNVTLGQLKSYNQHGNIGFIQNRFSLINRSVDNDFANYCSQHNIGIIPFQVIERGLLTNSSSNLKLHKDDLRNKKPEFSYEKRLVISKWVDKNLLPLAKRVNMPVSSLAIWWALYQPNIVCCLTGATSSAQVTENFKASKLPKNIELLSTLDKFYQELNLEISERYQINLREFLNF